MKIKQRKVKTAALFFSLFAFHAKNSYATTLTLDSSNPQTTTQAISQTGTYQGLDVQAGGSIDTSAGATNAVTANFDGGVSTTPLTVQVEAATISPAASAGLIQSGTGTTITSTGTGQNTAFYIVNSGTILSTGSSAFGFNTSGAPTRIYNLGVPATIQANDITLTSGSGVPVYLQLGVNTAVTQDTLPSAFRTPPTGPPLLIANTDGGSIAGPIITNPNTTLFVQGNFNLTGGLDSATSPSAGNLLANTYTGSTLQITSLVGTTNPLSTFNITGGTTTIGTSGDVNTLAATVSGASTHLNLTGTSTLAQSGSAATTLQLLNSGTIRINSGTASFNASITGDGTGTLVADPGAGNQVTLNNNISGVQNIQINSGGSSIGQGLLLNNVAVTGTTLSGTAPVTITIGTASNSAMLHLSRSSTDANTSINFATGSQVLTLGDISGINTGTIAGSVTGAGKLSGSVMNVYAGTSSAIITGLNAINIENQFFVTNGSIGLSNDPTDSPITFNNNTPTVTLAQLSGNIYSNITGVTLLPMQSAYVVTNPGTAGTTSGPISSISNLSLFFVGSISAPLSPISGTFTLRGAVTSSPVLIDNMYSTTVTAQVAPRGSIGVLNTSDSPITLNNGTLEYNGGNIYAPITGTNPNATINVTATSTAFNTIASVPSINVNNGIWTLSGTSLSGVNTAFNVGTASTAATTKLTNSKTIGISGSPLNSAMTLSTLGTVEFNGGTIYSNITGAGPGSGSAINVTAGGSNFSGLGGAGQQPAITGIPFFNVSNTTGGNNLFSIQNASITGATNFVVGNSGNTAEISFLAGSSIDSTSGIKIGPSGIVDFAGGAISAPISAITSNKGTVNILTSSTTGNTITNIGSIHVQNAGTIFTIQNNITGFGTYTNDASTTTRLNTGFTLSGNTLNNAGAFNDLPANTGTVTVTSLNNTGTYNIQSGAATNATNLVNGVGGVFNALGGSTLTATSLKNTGGVFNETGTVNTSTLQNTGIFNGNNGSNITVSSTLQNTAGIYNSQAGSILSAATLQNSATFNTQNGSTIMAPVLQNTDGTFNAVTGSLLSTSTLQNSGGTFNFGTTLAAPISGNNFSNTNSVSNPGNFSITNGGSLTITPGTTLTTAANGTGGFFLLSGGTFNTDAITNNGNFTLQTDTTLNFTSGGTGPFLNNGTLNLNLGAINTPAPSISTLITSSTATSTINVNTSFTTSNTINGIANFNVNNNGTSFIVGNTISGISNLFTANANTTTQVNTGGLIAFTGNGSFSLFGTLIMNGGSLAGNINGNPGSLISVTGNYNTAGNISNVPTINVTGSAMTINHNITGYSNFTADATSTVTLASGAVTAAVGGTFTNNGTLNLNGGSFQSPLTSTNPANSVLNINADQNFAFTVLNQNTINNNANVTTNQNISGYNNFLNNGSTTLNGNSTLTGNTFSNIGTLTLNSGSTIAGGALLENGTLNLSGGVFTAPLSSTNPGGSIINVNAANYAGQNYSTTQDFTNIGTFNINSGTFTVQNNISNYVNFVDNSIVTIAPGGAILGNITGGGSPNSTLNVNVASYTTVGTITGIQFINANSNSFIVNNAITGFNTFLVNNQATINPHGSLSGSTTLINSGGTMTLAGGNVQGNINGNPNSNLVINNNFSTSGSISGVTNINVTGGTFNINNPISGYSNFIDGSVVNLNSGGSFAGIQGTGGNSTLNINTNLTTTGPLGTAAGPLGIINIPKGITLTLNNSVFTDNFNNYGTIAMTNSQSVTGTNYVQTGTFTTTIQNATQYGQLVVNGPATVGGTINVVITEANSFSIQNGTTFDVITSTGLTDNNPAVIYPSSLFLSFVRDRDPGTPPNYVRIKAVRTPISSFTNGNPSIQGVATALDVLQATTSNSDVLNLLETLEEAPNSGAVTADLTSLTPLVNGMEIIPSLYTLNPLFDKIARHLGNLRLGQNTLSNFDSGYMAGDLAGYNGTVGPIFFGNAIKQEAQDNLDGYTALTGGLGVVIDVPLNCYVRVGTGITYSTTGVKTATTGSSNFINSIQGILYGSFDYFNYVFLDWMAGLAQNNYRTNRNIAFLAESAKGNFTGVQATGKAKVGINILFGNLEVTPLATWQYVRLNQRQYTETGAPGANLVVQGNHVTAVEVGAGLRLSEVSEPDTFIPEIHALALNYVRNPSLTITSQFVDGGPAFLSIGPLQPKTGANVGGSISFRVSEYALFMGGYDLEVRKRLTSQSIYLKFRMLF